MKCIVLGDKPKFVPLWVDLVFETESELKSFLKLVHYGEHQMLDTNKVAQQINKKLRSMGYSYD